MALVENLDVYFGAFALTVVAGGKTGKGILDNPSTIAGDAMAISDDYILMAKASDFGALRAYDDITVDGTAYSVRSVRRIDDGKIVEISMAKV